MSRHVYEECSERDVPAGVRFDVPRHLQGRMVEVAYGGFDRAEHGPGDPYKRETDRSTPWAPPRYYRIVGGRS